jgi:hypothetical protein
MAGWDEQYQGAEGLDVRCSIPRRFHDHFWTGPHGRSHWRAFSSVFEICRIGAVEIAELDVGEPVVAFSVVDEDIIEFNIFMLGFSETLAGETNALPVCTKPSSWSTFNASSILLETYWSSLRFRVFWMDAFSKWSSRYVKTMIGEADGSLTSSINGRR